MFRALVVCTAVCLIGPSNASAASPAEKTEANKLFEQGREALEGERFQQAVDLFTKANELDPNPILKGFMARAYEDLGLSQTKDGELSAARDSYRLARDNYATLAVDPSASRSARDKAKQRVPRIETTLNDLEKALAAREATRVPVEPPSTDEPDKPDTIMGDPKGDDVANGKTAPPVVPPDPGTDLVLPGAITLGAGAVLAAVGVLMLVDASDKRSQVNDAETNAAGQITSVTQVDAKTLEEDADTNATIGAIGLGLGAAAIAAGTIMILISDDGEPEMQGRTTISAATDGRGVLLTAMGRF